MDPIAFLSSFHFPTADFEADLQTLTAIVGRSTQDQNFRVQLQGVYNELERLIASPPLDTNNLRIFRGILLIVRNVVSEEHSFDIDPILKSLIVFRSQKSQIIADMYDKTVVVYYQILANFSAVQKPRCMELFSQVAPSQNDPEHHRLPVIVASKNLLENPENVYDILTNQYGEAIMQLLMGFMVTDSPTELEMLHIQTWEKIIVHEKFSKWIVVHQNIQVFKIAQIVITSRDNWNNYELIGILSWLFEQYKEFDRVTIQAFESSDFDALNSLHAYLLIVLDCISELCKFIIAKDFLVNYKLINNLVPLLGTVHKNIAPKNMLKKTDTGKVSFPHIKSIIIEIISYLVYDNFEMQEAVRELHGLEVILSNCIIDDNNPFVKERAIICLKYLLAKNPENQKLVASLEAQREVDANILDQIGSEVTLNEGHIKLADNKGNFSK